MTPKEASKVIGCSPRHVRWLIKRGKIAAEVHPCLGGFYYEVPDSEATRYRDYQPKGGFPRGRSRGERRRAYYGIEVQN